MQTHGQDALQARPDSSRFTLYAGIAVGVMLVGFISVMIFFKPSASNTTAVPSEPQKETSVVKKAITLEPTKKSEIPIPPEPEPKLTVKPSATPKPDTALMLSSAIELLKNSKFAEAEKSLRKVVSIEPNNPSAHNHLGFALKKQGKVKEAVKEYEKAIQLMPDNPEAINNLAVATEELGNKKKAEEFYKKALALKPDYEQAVLNYALLLDSDGKRKEARALFEKFMRISDNPALKQMVGRRIR